MELGIVPDAPGSEGYVELGATPQGSLWKKHFMTLGPKGSFVHPRTGQKLTMGDDFWQSLKSNFDGKVATDYVQVPVVDSANKHTENPLANIGEVVDLQREGDKLYAIIDARDEQAAPKLGRTLLGCSAFLNMNATDPRTGRKCGPVLYHLAVTNRGHLVELEPFEQYAPVIAATGEAWEMLPDGSGPVPPWVLMLAAPEADPDPPVLLADSEPAQPDYADPYGGDMDEDFLKVEAARLGILAYQESVPGRGTRPEYGTVITDHDRAAALSAEAEITDQDIIEATAELAMAHRVSPDSVFMMCHDAHIRSGLGRSELERARVLGEVQVALSRGKLEVTDEQVVALSQLYDGTEEILRLTAEPGYEDMFLGLAHPSRSGKLVTSKTRAHVRDTDDEDPQDHDQPARGGEVHKKLRRIFEANPDLFTDGTGHEGGKGKTRYGPRSPRERSQAAIRARGPGVRPPD